jgi:hypothetical protein
VLWLLKWLVKESKCLYGESVPNDAVHQGREFIANGALENGAFCTVFSENFHKF